MSNNDENPELGDLYLNDGCDLKSFIRYALEDPDPWCVPGGDRIDTIVSLIMAYAPHFHEAPRYTRWINELKYYEHCIGMGLESPAEEGTFSSQFFRKEEGPTKAAFVWRDKFGPTKAMHFVRTSAGVEKRVWRREARQ